MRILMTTDDVGGVWTYALDLTRALSARGVEVHLAVLGEEPDGGRRAQLASAGAQAFHVRRTSLEWMDDPWDEVDATGRWLEALARAVRPDLVHVNSYADAARDFGAPVLCVAHSCVLSWWRAVEEEPAPARYAEYRARVTRGLDAAEVVVTPTAAMLTELRRNYGFDTQAMVIPNGRRPGLFHPGPKEPLVAGVGRLWDKAKNLSLLCEAAASLPWRVVLAGEAEHPGGGVASFDGVGVAGRLPERELAGLLSRAAILCAPARYEPFGLAALEAALSGCALVLGDIPSLREVWGDAAVYVDPWDPEALAGKLNLLIEDRGARRSLQGAAWRRAASFTAGAMAERYLAVYGELTARAPAPTGSRR